MQHEDLKSIFLILFKSEGSFIFKGLMAIVAILTFSSCSYFEKSEERTPVVRVNDSYLYREDIEQLVDEDISPEDSAVIVSNYINRWATQQLLIDRAEMNLPTRKQEEFNALVENYRNELYTSAYKETMVTQSLDSSLADEAIESYYEQNQQNFKLNEDLVKLRYINLASNNTNLDEIKRKFVRFNVKDQEELSSQSLQFKNYSMNDSAWVRTKSVFDKIGPLSASNKDELLEKSNYLELKDSLNLYMVYVKDVLLRGEQAPLEYASATIREILLNKRKQELIKQLETDITKDAIEKDEFEIYNE